VNGHEIHQRGCGVSFKPGDICVLVDANGAFRNKALINATVTVIGLVFKDSKFDYYTVEEFPGYWFAENELRRIDSNYDGNQLSSWDCGPFDPYKQRVRV
jgi:hypothetical protein